MYGSKYGDEMYEQVISLSDNRKYVVSVRQICVSCVFKLSLVRGATKQSIAMAGDGVDAM
jgi:hypothetical protein